MWYAIIYIGQVIEALPKLIYSDSSLYGFHQDTAMSRDGHDYVYTTLEEHSDMQSLNHLLFYFIPNQQWH